MSVDAVPEPEPDYRARVVALVEELRAAGERRRLEDAADDDA